MESQNEFKQRWESKQRHAIKSYLRKKRILAAQRRAPVSPIQRARYDQFYRLSTRTEDD